MLVTFLFFLTPNPKYLNYALVYFNLKFLEGDYFIIYILYVTIMTKTLSLFLFFTFQNLLLSTFT